MPNSKEQPEQVLSLQDLRAIIHGLKMSGLSFLEEDARDAVGIKIAELPSPEQLISMLNTPEVLKKLTAQIGEILRLVELYGKRDGEYKARFKSKKGLPPRYKVLEWRANMKSKSDAIKLMVRTSARLDNLGNGELASSFLKCAKGIKEETLTPDQLTNAIEKLGEGGYVNEQREVVAALAPYANPTGVGGGMADVGKAVGGFFSNVMQKGKDIFRAGLWTRRLQSTIQQVEQVIADLGKAVQQAGTGTPQAQTLNQILEKHQAALQALKGAYGVANAAETQTAQEQTAQEQPAPQEQAAPQFDEAGAIKQLQGMGYKVFKPKPKQQVAPAAPAAEQPSVAQETIPVV